MTGVPCGVVVVEERDARGSSVRRSKRTGTLVYATRVAQGCGGGKRGGAVLELVGDAGVETYAFQRGTCNLFRSFIHQGKLTVCTAGLRHQIMMSEADPSLLAELCATLLEEEDIKATSSPPQPPPPPPRPSFSYRARAGANAGLSQRPCTTAVLPTGRSGNPSRPATGLVRPLQVRSVNLAAAPSLSVSSKVRVGLGGVKTAVATATMASTTTGSTSAAAAGAAAAAAIAARAALKGRRMGTPTKSSVGGRLPERKSTRKVSPQKEKKQAPSSSSSSSASHSKEELSLSEDQQRAVDFVLDGKSVFFTGCAGTGKSLVLNRILSALAEAGTSGVYATATTGLAACHVKGTTLQQFAGIGKARGSGEEVLKIVKKRPDAVRRWKAAQVLIVDEVSMLDAGTFDALDYVARELRGSPAPFGGIRLVLSGDFFQLPPVFRRGEPEKKLCFEASSWKTCVQKTVELRLVYRQRDDRFVKLLSKIRWGQCTPEVLAELRSCSGRRLGQDDGIEETQLLTHKADVQRVNEERLSQLNGAEVLSKADDKSSKPDHLKQLDGSCSAPGTLRLKVGAQVILVKNMATGRGLANGSRGVVVRFATSSGARLPVVRFTSGLEEVIRPETFPLYVGGAMVASRRQLPLALAWALSVHKSQGMSLDRASVCLSRAFEYGQAYVALSRVKSLDGLSITGSVDPSKIRAHPRVVAFYRALSQERRRRRG